MIAIFVSSSGGWMSQVPPCKKREVYLSSMSITFGALSAERTICFPRVTKKLRIWNWVWKKIVFEGKNCVFTMQVFVMWLFEEFGKNIINLKNYNF